MQRQIYIVSVSAIFAFTVCTSGVFEKGLTRNQPELMPSVTHAPRLPVEQEENSIRASAARTGWSSSNWSGYAVTNGPYRDITGRWVLPAVQPSTRNFASSWVGIDGFNNGSLIQTGTDEDYFNGYAHYYAWWEVYPARETRIYKPIHAGDKIFAHIYDNHNGTWTIDIQNITEKWDYTTRQPYFGPAESAEWIQEASTVRGKVTPLSHFKQVTFQPNTVNGASPQLSLGDSGVMIQQGVQVATPSGPNRSLDAFSVAYGPKTPVAPTPTLIRAN